MDFALMVCKSIHFDAGGASPTTMSHLKVGILLAFSSGRRGTVLTVDEVFYSDCPVEHHNKSFSFENLTFSFVRRQNYNNSTPHPSPEGDTFSHWRRL